jgi:hypothetical protein
MLVTEKSGLQEQVNKMRLESNIPSLETGPEKAGLLWLPS